MSSVLEDATFLLARVLASPHIQCSVAFPELVVPILVSLRKSLKKASGGKEATVVKGLVDRVEETSKIMSTKRKGLDFGPRAGDKMRQWEKERRSEAETGDTPLGKYVKSQLKLREKRKKLVEKVCIWMVCRRDCKY